MRRGTAALTAVAAVASAHSAEILYNQIGYYPEKPKIAYVADSEEQGFELIEVATGEAALSGVVGGEVPYPAGGLSLRRIDLSARTAPGAYFIRLEDGAESDRFQIGLNLLDEARAASLKAFYYNRATQAISAEFGGKWSRPLGHPDDEVRYHPSTGRSEGAASSPKGWYDAGDYGKYVVNGGYALATLLSLHELFPHATGDATGIPESGNGLSDLLDEARWELEWFLSMQDEDGGVYHKLTALNFAGFVMPHQATAPRYFIGKSVTATLNFAACLAQAGRVYREVDSEFAAACLEAAERAWAWAKANPNATYAQPPGVNTGAYDDGDPADEFEWAAAQLLLSTGNAVYEDELASLTAFANLDEAAGWPNTRNLAAYSLATVEAGPSSALRQAMRSGILFKAQEALAQIEENPLRSPLRSSEFYWGSNGVAAAKGVLFAYAYHISGEERYAEGMADVADYLLGRNATGYSFLTGYGARTPLHIHHRPSAADGVSDPVPGFLVGGPNSGREDSVAYPYPLSQPARSYVDVLESYASNEIAINWNAPLVFLLTALEQSQANAFHPTPDLIYASPNELLYGSVLANDTSNPGAQLSAEWLTRPRLGAFNLESNGVVTLDHGELPYGNYYFQYRSHHGNEASEPILVTLSMVPATFDREGPPPTAYEAWLFNYPLLTGEDAAPGSDPDADGVTNLWEHLFGGDPLAFEAQLPGGLQMLPPSQDGRHRAQLRAVADVHLNDTSVALLARHNLQSDGWYRPSQEGYPEATVEASEPDPQTGLAEFRYTFPGASASALFLRLAAAPATEP